ncbi:MAG: enoyl-CoA hydratase/isomerase family protein, partial [Saprospiraceae bacterium]
MEYFNKNLFEKPLEETYAFIKLQEDEHTLTITLDRAKKKNAIHPKMVDELAFALQYAKISKHIWVIVIAAEGNVFCAGADLKAFMGILGEFESSIPKAE